MKITNKEIKSILILIDNRINQLKTEKNSQLTIKKLEQKHYEHIKVYGEGNERRLTGKDETCDINTFRWGVSDRGASVRVPWQVAKDGCGYLEDRRPAANCNPYLVAWRLIKTICGDN